VPRNRTVLGTWYLVLGTWYSGTSTLNLIRT
jgi:hypothetical protein